MKNKQEEKMSKEEIIHYVDDLIKVNKRSYDKRLSPLLYEFFLRANEKFEWSREEFLKKYQNFKNNVKKLKITDMGKVGMLSSSLGEFSYRKNNKGIYINKKIIIENVNNNSTNESINLYIIDNLFHECLHATDLIKVNENIKQDGLYHRGNNNEGDTMLNEYANVLASSLISSDKPMYTDNYGIDFINNGSYGNLKCPGEIICAALDITEPQLAKLKDKGGDLFYEYLQNKFPYVNIEATLDVFKSSLNVIYNASINKDKENISLGFKNMIDAANILMSNRLDNALKQGKDGKETIERIYYNIYKIKKIVRSVDRIYKLDGNNKVFNNNTLLIGLELEKKVKIYNRFLDNEEIFTQEEKEAIQNGENVKEIIESKFDDNYIDSEFAIEEIVSKYYPQSKEPLNDNTKLIEYVRKTFEKPISKSISEKITELINKIKYNGLKLLPLPKLEKLEEMELLELEKMELPTVKEIKIQEMVKTTKQKASNFRDSVKYETKIEHKISKEKENEDISKDEEESTRE